MKTHLSLFFQDVVDFKNIFVQDNSEYNSDLPITNPTIEVTPPNFSTIYVSSYPSTKIFTINSNTLGWTNTYNHNELTPLSDGLWIIKQSIEPNGVVFKQYNYFRITKAKHDIIVAISNKLDENCDCNMSDKWFSDMFKLLQRLEAAKYLVEQCGKCIEGSLIFNQVKSDFLDMDVNSTC